MIRQNIVITGASEGIGKALAWEMAGRGYNLGLTSRRESVLEKIKLEINARYPNLLIAVAPLDVSEFSDIENTLSQLRSELGGIDILVANAGIAKSGRVGVMPLEDQLDVINTNLNGAIATVSAGVKIFREQGYGHVVATSSIAGYLGLPRNAAYSASKAGLSIYMESVRAETYEEKIDVTVINPGYIDTAINRGLKSRPFVIDVKDGASQFATLIEKKVKVATVPRYPWNILGTIMKVLPISLIAKM